jgi:uncharacterized protein YsxB (DUF464 family)
LVEVRIRKDSRGRLSSFFTSGHAESAAYGEDVVCAAVSALLQGAWFGLMEVAGVEVTSSKGDGRLELSWPEDARDDVAAQAIVKTAAVSVERIAAQNPAFVRVIHELDDG